MDGSSRPTFGAHPDALLQRQRRMQRAAVEAKLAIAYATPTDFREKRKGTIKVHNAKAKKCKGCGRMLGPLRQWYGHKGKLVFCTDCRPQAQQLKAIDRYRPSVERTCPVCAVTYPKLRHFFGPSGTWTICRECREKAGNPKALLLASARKRMGAT